MSKMQQRRCVRWERKHFVTQVSQNARHLFTLSAQIWDRTGVLFWCDVRQLRNDCRWDGCHFHHRKLSRWKQCWFAHCRHHIDSFIELLQLQVQQAYLDVHVYEEGRGRARGVIKRRCWDSTEKGGGTTAYPRKNKEEDTLLRQSATGSWTKITPSMGSVNPKPGVATTHISVETINRSHSIINLDNGKTQ